MLVPAIIYYELRRELLRAKKNANSPGLTPSFKLISAGYPSLSDEALRLVATLWAEARQQGQPASSEGNAPKVR